MPLTPARKIQLLALLAFAACLSGPTSQAQPPSLEDQPPIVRWPADELECPPETEVRRAESPDGKFSAVWCEIRRSGQVARHGPYLELHADGSTLRQGVYYRGLQAGQWVSFSKTGQIEREIVIRPGEASRFLPQPEDICPPGTRRDRSTGYDHRLRMWSQCERTDENGEKILEGPYITWDEDRSPEGVRYVLRQIMTYRDDERHGHHAVFEGPFAKEVLVEEETFFEGHPEGESRAYFLDGGLREVRHYLDGQFHGERVAYYPGGKERWRIVYEKGQKISAEGELAVAGEPCPGETVPTMTADTLEVRCARRYLHFEELTGPFLVRDRDGNVVESGLYEYGTKTELWQSNGKRLPPKVSDETLVAEAVMKVGEQVYDLPTPVDPGPDPWESADLTHEDPAELQAELDRVQALAEAHWEALENPEVNVWFRNRKTKKYAYPNTEIVNGQLRIYGLSPGTYYMQVEVDADKSNPHQYPGDLNASTIFEVELDQVTQVEAPLLHSLRVLEPWDNNEPIPGWGNPCGEKESLPRQVRFTWTPPADENPEDIEWEYRLSRVTCQPTYSNELLKEGKTYDTSISFDLAPSRRAQAYEFTLLARRGDKVIGQLMSFGKDGGHGWAIRFRAR